MLHGSERGQAAAAERRRLGGIEVPDRKQVPPGGDEQVLGIAAILEDAALAAVRADHLLAHFTPPAVAAAPGRVDEDRPDAVDLTRYLVSEHERERRRREVPLDDMQIGVADARREHANDDLVVVCDLRDRPLFEAKLLAESIQDDRAHGGPF